MGDFHLFITSTSCPPLHPPALPSWAPEIPHTQGSWNMLPHLALTSFDRVGPPNDNNSFSIGLFNKLLCVVHQATRQKITQVSQKPDRTRVGWGGRKGSKCSQMAFSQKLGLVCLKGKSTAASGKRTSHPWGLAPCLASSRSLTPGADESWTTIVCC